MPEEISDRNEVRAQIADGGWTILWGDVLDEADVITLAAAIPTGTVAGWVAEQVAVQVQEFSQSFADVSEDIIHQATEYLKGLLGGNQSGEADIDGVGAKAGFATYHRKLKLWKFKIPLPNNYQPYIGLRVTRPLPPKGSKATIEPVAPVVPVAPAEPVAPTEPTGPAVPEEPIPTVPVEPPAPEPEPQPAPEEPDDNKSRKKWWNWRWK